MNSYIINFRDGDERFCGAAGIQAASLAEACIWARTMMADGQHALIWDGDDNLLCILMPETAGPAVHQSGLARAALLS